MCGVREIGSGELLMSLRFSAVLVVLCIVQVLLCGCSGDEKQEASVASAEISASGSTVAKQIFKSVPGVEAQRIIGANKELLLLDVRTPQERHQLRIAGSHLVPVGNIVRGKLQLPKDQPVMLVCAVGGRSYLAAKVLSRMGYREVYNLDGGIEAWRRAGLPVQYGPESKK